MFQLYGTKMKNNNNSKTIFVIRRIQTTITMGTTFLYEFVQQFFSSL